MGNKAEGEPSWDSEIQSAPGPARPAARRNRTRSQAAREEPGARGRAGARGAHARTEAGPAASRQDLTLRHVAREPARHVAAVQRKALPPGGPGGTTQRARSPPHGAASSSAAHREGRAPRRTSPPGQRPGPRVPALQRSAARPARAHDAPSGGGRSPAFWAPGGEQGGATGRGRGYEPTPDPPRPSRTLAAQGVLKGPEFWGF